MTGKYVCVFWSFWGYTYYIHGSFGVLGFIFWILLRIVNLGKMWKGWSVTCTQVYIYVSGILQCLGIYILDIVENCKSQFHVKRLKVWLVYIFWASKQDLGIWCHPGKEPACRFEPRGFSPLWVLRLETPMNDFLHCSHFQLIPSWLSGSCFDPKESLAHIVHNLLFATIFWGN